MVIYTHNITADIMDIFDDALGQLDITVPSPEDAQKDDNNDAVLYGSVYANIFEEIESYLTTVLNDAGVKTKSGAFVG